MSAFKYIKPNNIKELYSLFDKIQEKNFYLLAGGTDFFIKVKSGIYKPDGVFDISELSDIRFIEDRGNDIYIGAGITFLEILNSDLLKNKFPALIEAAKTIGSPQIRTVATIGGNACNASPTGDSFSPLVVHEAKVVIGSAAGEKTVDLENFFAGRQQTILKKGEILKSFIINPLCKNEYSGFRSLGQRNAIAIAKVSCAARWRIENGKITFIRIAYGSVAPTVIRANKTEEFLLGKEINVENIEKAMQLASDDVRPITDIRSTKEYRKETAGVLLKRILLNQ